MFGECESYRIFECLGTGRFLGWRIIADVDSGFEKYDDYAGGGLKPIECYGYILKFWLQMPLIWSGVKVILFSFGSKLG